MDLQALTDQLVRLRQSGQTYRFVHQAHHVLAAACSAPELALLTLESLLELGWGGPARELLQVRRDLDRTDPRVAALAERAASAPNGRLAWSELSAQYEQNLAILLRRMPQLAACLKPGSNPAAALHLFCAPDGAYHLSERKAGELRRWLPPLSLRDAESRVTLPPKGELGPVVVIGARVSSLLERIHRDTDKLFLTYSHPVFLLEPEPAYFAAWLHCANVPELLADERLYCLVGPQAVEALEQLLKDEPALAMPAMCVNQTDDPHVVGRTLQAAERAAQHRAAQLTRLAQELRTRYQPRSAAWWAAELQPPGPVLAVTSRFTTVLQYSTRDALHALERMGYVTRLVIEERDHHQLSSINLCRTILDCEPAMILILDHLRYEYPHVPPGVPFLTWIQDPMPNLLCAEAGRSVGPLDFVCGYYRDRCAREFGYPADAFQYADIPVSTSVFHDAELDAGTNRRYACDISFVSNASMPIDRFHESSVASYPAALRPMLEAVYQRALEVLRSAEQPRLSDEAERLVRTAASEFGVRAGAPQLETLTTNYAYRLLDWGRRHQTLEWVADWARRTGRDFRIYGRGWEQHPTLGAFAAGVLDHGEPLRAACRASKLALQIIPSGFWHQRSYELLAAGTLPLTRHCPDDFDFLPMDEFIRRRDSGERLGGAAAAFPKLERIVFRTQAEFEALAERFLADQPYRAQVQTELRDIVLRDYTYEAVMRRVMQAFQSRLQRLSDAQGARTHAALFNPQSAIHNPQ